MKPIGPLMREHRLIERMVALLDTRSNQMTSSNIVDVNFVTTAIDFIRIYADRTHHGKEEDILFKALAVKTLSPEHLKIMNELVAEHVYGRKVTAGIANARLEYLKGNTASLTEIVAGIRKLVDFYPAHIEKEDKRFFYPSLEYLSSQEQDNMLLEFRDFDGRLIHEKYEGLVVEFEKGAR